MACLCWLQIAVNQQQVFVFVMTPIACRLLLVSFVILIVILSFIKIEYWLLFIKDLLF